MSDSLNPNQRRTLSARQALASKFVTPEEKSAHYRDMARRANEGRVVLNASEAEALGQAYALLGRIAQRGKIATPPTDQQAA
jgi:hypothetical protein